MVKAVILCGPSGSGKSTLAKYILNKVNRLHFSISACSRLPRKEEQNGIDYYFMEAEDFRQKIHEGAFLEYEEVYPGKFYGTLKSEFEKATLENKVLLFDVDVKGGLSLKKKLGDKSLSIFIAPPSIAVLGKRLKKRKTENLDSIATRIEKAEYELSFQDQFDCVLVNDNLEESYINITNYVQKHLS